MVVPLTVVPSSILKTVSINSRRNIIGVEDHVASEKSEEYTKDKEQMYTMMRVPRFLVC